MITQKPISMKIDAALLEELDLECYVSGQPRNRVINAAVRLYCDMTDKRRRIALIEDSFERHDTMACYFETLSQKYIL